MALHYIAMSLSDEDFQKVKGYLKDIEKIVAEQTDGYVIKPYTPTNSEILEALERAEQTEPSEQTDCAWK